MGVVALDFIKTTVCDYYNVAIQDLEMPDKFNDILLPRQVYHYLMRKYSKSKLADISCGKNHSTVIHSEKVIEYKYKTNQSIKNDVDALCEIIETSNVKHYFRNRLTLTGLKKEIIKDILTCKDRKSLNELITTFYNTSIKIIDSD